MFADLSRGLYCDLFSQKVVWSLLISGYIKFSFSILAVTRWLHTSCDVTLPKDLFRCLHLLFCKYLSHWIIIMIILIIIIRSVLYLLTLDIIICLFHRFWGEEEENPTAKGFGHSGPLPCSGAFSGNTGSLAGVQWTCSEQRQVYDPLTKHQKTRSNQNKQTRKLKPTTTFNPLFIPLVGFWLSVAWLACDGDGLL